MNNPGLFQSRWNLGRLVLCNVVPLALLAFWLWPTGQMLCVIFDEWLFRSLNAPLASNPIWLHIWAIASLRPFDIIVGLILLTLLIKGDWVFKAIDVRRAFFGFFSILLLMVVIRALFSKFADYMDWQHSSPSMVLEGAVHLSDYFRTWKSLGAEGSLEPELPGDHASVLLIWALFMGVFSRTVGQFLTVWAWHCCSCCRVWWPARTGARTITSAACCWRCGRWAGVTTHHSLITPPTSG